MTSSPQALGLCVESIFIISHPFLFSLVLIVMASNLLAMGSNLIAMASTFITYILHLTTEGVEKCESYVDAPSRTEKAPMDFILFWRLP